MLYLKWFVFTILNLIMKYVVNFPLAPIIVLFAKEDGYLPNWLSWFQTFDNSLDGDGGWVAETRPYLNESNKYQRWVNRFHWLWRNSTYGFSRSVTGVTYTTTDTLVKSGDEGVGNGPGGKSGFMKRHVYRDNKLIAFQIYYIRQYQRWPNKCIRLNLGWKIWEDTYGNAMHVFSPSPYMHFIK